MIRIGWASPLPPARSGIADYSARLLPAVAEYAELELLVESGAPPDPALAARFPCRPLADLPRLAGEPGLDAVVYQLGNHPRFHGAIYRALLAHPGIVVLHEAVLHHMLRELTLAVGDAEGYVEAMRYAYGPAGEAAARRAIATGVPLDPYRYPLFERAVDAARAVVVHSRTTRDRVLSARPEARVEVIPHFVEIGEEARGAAADPAAARAVLGLPRNALVVATFGYLTSAKRLDACFAAFARLRAQRPDAVLLLVGEVAPDLDLQRRLSGEAGAGVRVLGHLPLDRFLAAMVATDVAFGLRYPTGGETSGAVMRLLALGRPVLVTDAGAFAEIPDGCAAKVPPDAFESETLAAILERLAADSALRSALGENARRWVSSACSLPVVAKAYANLVEEVVESGLTPLSPFPPVPPLAPYPRADLLSELLRRAGAELADLGVAEAAGDDDLTAIAQSIVEIGLDRAS